MRPTGEGLSDQERYDQGMVVRREVLSDEHVDRSTAGANELTAEWQDSSPASRGAMCGRGRGWTDGLDRSPC